jgi:hypothetical protein
MAMVGAGAISVMVWNAPRICCGSEVYIKMPGQTLPNNKVNDGKRM